MKKIALALASTAIAAAASSTFISTAEAGGRGGRFHFGFRHFSHHHHFRHFHAPSPSYEDFYVRRRKPKVVVKYITKTVPQATIARASKRTTIAAAKTEDGQGRMFDPVSKAWFDGNGQCWKGDKAFAYRSGSWFYGNARWIETSAGWGVASGTAPQLVSCDGIQAFSGAIQQANAPAAPKAAQAPVTPAPAQVANAPAPTPAPAPEPQATTTAAPAAPATTARECKKYFPSVGEMVTVPCAE